MKGRLGKFLGGALVFWGVASGAACLLYPEQRPAVLVCSTIALGVCLIPTLITLVWSMWGLKQSPEQQLVAVLGGTGVRMFFVLGAGLVLSLSLPVLREQQGPFWILVGIYYLATLALEMALLLRAQSGMTAAVEAKKSTAPSE